MRDFQALYDIAAQRKGGADWIETHIVKPKPPHDIAAGEDSGWLAAMTKCIFQAGFNWSVVEAKWSGIEQAFDGFSPARCAAYADEDLDRLLSDKRIIRHGPKIKSICENAAFLCSLERRHGSAARFFADQPVEEYLGLLDYMSIQGSRLGGATGQRVLRMMGVDSFILSPDVCSRLIAEGIVDKRPASKRDMAAVQAGFLAWRAQSGRSFTEISRILAWSIGS